MKRITIIGGDDRFSILRRMISESGQCVYEEDYCNTDILVLPLPVTRDKTHINNSNVTVSDVANKIGKDTFVLMGKAPCELCERLDERGIKYRDYYDREEFAVFNAQPTAEGAIEAAMKYTDVTLKGSNCIVVGYGRVGNVLCYYLNGTRANITVAARKKSVLAWANVYGYNTLHLNRLESEIGKFDIVFNTVPYPVINRGVIAKMKKNALLLDLASGSGIDFDYSNEVGVNAIKLPSIPGKVAPHTAAEIIYKTINNILSEEYT